ncbi:hypothetical protein Q2T40_15255 [Winogradskyella maritima]|uniref:Lipoprotein n=1 Tax=Winogradskyella maritima TaxID=1517766 RepID=A0ABV8AIS0_9FLAO|nr:hypothetical protein [Winogradskyella maritima]
MKHLKFTAALYLGLIIFGLSLTSCTKDNEFTEELITADSQLELERAAEIDAVESALSDLVIQVYENDNANASGRSAQPPALPDCVTITLVAQQNFRELTIDFGSEGCLVRGHLLKGQLVIDYTRDPEAQEVTINYNLIDFYFDNKNVLGSRSILKERSNANGNPQFTHTLDLTVIWPSGLEASREGLKIKEWVEGAGSGIFSDNVFEVTGNWTSTFRNGNAHSYEVMEPLRREVICTYFVSGTVDVSRTNFGGVFDFGDGDCDNQATFTYNNGNVLDITLN